MKKLREVRRFRHQFWPDQPWMTRLETRDIRVECHPSLVWHRGVGISLELDPKVTPPVPPDFTTWTAITYAFDYVGAKLAIEQFHEGGWMWVDLYFEAVRNGETSDRGYAKWIRSYGFPVTTGQYKLFWRKNREKVPEAIAFVAKAPENLEIFLREEKLREHHQVSLDGFGGKWAAKKG